MELDKFEVGSDDPHLMNAPLQAHRVGSTTLPDERTIGWACYGDPDGDTVLWFHGTPGARAQLPHDAGDLAIERGIRIVTVERPGTGDSSPHVYSSIIEFADDLTFVLDDLGIDEFGVVALSGGGPYLLATAHELGHRMKAGIVLGGIGPTRGSDSIVSHTMLLVPAAALLERVRSPLSTGLSKLIHLITPISDPTVDIFMKLMPGDRAHMTARPLDRRQFTADLINANERSGVGSAVNDLILFGRHWGFELRNVKVPIVFYGGSSDVIVPYLHAERQSKRVHGSRLRTYEGRGHFAGYTTPADILDDLRDLWPQKPKAVTKAADAEKAPAKRTAAKKAPAKKATSKKAPAKTAAV